MFVGADLRTTTPTRSPRPRASIEGYVGTGSAASVASGRIAYTFGLEGPGGHRRHGVLVVAGRAAPRRARRCAAGECSLALAGGVTVMATPGAVRRVQPPARAGARRPLQVVLGAGADGTGWGEGVGMLVLERLSRRAAQRPSRCWRWCAARRSTRTARANGLTAPNGPAQERVIRAGAGQRRAVAGGRRRRRGARHRHDARRPDRGAGAARRPTAQGGRASGRCGWARSSRTSGTRRRRPASPA